MNQTGQVKCMHGVNGNDFGELESTAQCKENEETSSGWLADRQKRGPTVGRSNFSTEPRKLILCKNLPNCNGGSNFLNNVG